MTDNEDRVRTVTVTHVLIVKTLHSFGDYNEDSIDGIRRFEATSGNRDPFEILEDSDSIEIITQVEETPDDERQEGVLASGGDS